MVRARKKVTAGGGGASVYGLPWTGQITIYTAGDDASWLKGYNLIRPIVKGPGGTRLVINGDGTVTDLATGLMWPQDLTGPGSNNHILMNWQDAITFCNTLNFAGHADWRMPNVKELVSILDYETPKNGNIQFLDEAVWIGNVGGPWWSSTTDWKNDAAGHTAFGVDPGLGLIEYFFIKTIAYLFTIAVRGGLP